MVIKAAKEVTLAWWNFAGSLLCTAAPALFRTPVSLIAGVSGLPQNVAAITSPQQRSQPLGLYHIVLQSVIVTLCASYARWRSG